MALFQHIYDLNMDASAVPLVINKSLGDTNFTLCFIPYATKGEFDIDKHANGMTTTSGRTYFLEGTLPGGETKISIPGRYGRIGSDTYCIQFDMTDLATSIAGDVLMQVRLRYYVGQNKPDLELRSSKIILRVEPEKPEKY